jgi:hypothetical protein
MDTCGIVAKNENGEFVCVVQRYYPGPDNFFHILKQIKSIQLNRGSLNADLSELLRNYDFRYDFLRESLTYRRMGEHMRNNSDKLNEELIKKIFRKLCSIQDHNLPFFINPELDFNYCISFPKGTQEGNENHINCAMREWDEETLLNRPTGSQRQESIAKRGGRNHYFEFSKEQTFTSNGKVRKNPEEIVGVIYLDQNELLKFIFDGKSNGFTSSFFKGMRPTANTVVKTDNLIGTFNPETVDTKTILNFFERKDVFNIIIQELKEYKDNGFNPSSASAGGGQHILENISLGLIKNKRKTKKGKSPKKNKSQKNKKRKSPKKKSQKNKKTKLPKKKSLKN